MSSVGVYQYSPGCCCGPSGCKSSPDCGTPCPQPDMLVNCNACALTFQTWQVTVSGVTPAAFNGTFYMTSQLPGAACTFQSKCPFPIVTNTCTTGPTFTMTMGSMTQYGRAGTMWLLIDGGSSAAYDLPGPINCLGSNTLQLAHVGCGTGWPDTLTIQPYEQPNSTTQ